MSRKTINTIENGVFIPSVLLALSLAGTLGTTVDALFFVEPGPGAAAPGGVRGSAPP